jgi:membrane protein required for colicin V production
MTVFDYTVLAIVVLSIVISVIRGLLREVLALAAWAIGFIVASVFAADAAALLAPQVPDERVRLLVAFSGVFLAVLLGMSLLAMLLSRLAQSAGFGLEDRVLGSVFGLARGVLIVTTLVLAAGLTALPRQPEWRDAFLSGPFEAFAGHIRSWLPAPLAQRITYARDTGH